MSGSRPVWRYAAAVTALVVAAACARLGLRHVGRHAEPPATHAPIGGVGPRQWTAVARPGACRILLDEAALARLRAAASAKTPAFEHVLARANEALEKPVSSGYQGFEWADAVADLALAWRATSDTRYAVAGVRYLNALLDDRFEVGDRQGGDQVVRNDSGYGIRTFGAYTALGYDWLRGAPGFDDALRQRALERLTHWLSWYASDGYLRDHPLANYYWGYLTTLSFAGLAASGDSAAADGWLTLARSELTERALPALRDELRGGGWPEGWQYGEYTTMEIALVAEAFRTGAGVDLVRHLPWLADTVRHHTHALLPDQSSVYDGGTWGEHPARPSALALSAVSIALESAGDPSAAEARWLVAHALPSLEREQAWVGLLAERPGAAERSPRGALLSLELEGQGLTFARSDWSAGATWLSFQAGPWLAEDHQDADAGHFELFRGHDGLLVDAGDSEGSATINHNTLLVDDHGYVLTYPPNQGVWGADRVKTTRFADDSLVVVAVGELGEAYAPACAEDGCSKRAVERMTRSLVYVRPSLLVMDDRVTLARPDSALIWAAHLTRNPTLDGSLASAVIGASRVDIRTLEPPASERQAKREPTPSGEGSHRANKVWGALWRLEIASPAGSRERGFLHVITAGSAGSAVPSAQSLGGDLLHGARVEVDGRRTAVLFLEGGHGASVPLDGPADVVAVAGLTPAATYRLTIDARCVLTVALAAGADTRRASAGGLVRLDDARCGQ